MRITHLPSVTLYWKLFDVTISMMNRNESVPIFICEMVENRSSCGYCLPVQRWLQRTQERSWLGYMWQTHSIQWPLIVTIGFDRAHLVKTTSISELFLFSFLDDSQAAFFVVLTINSLWKAKDRRIWLEWNAAGKTETSGNCIWMMIRTERLGKTRAFRKKA